MYGDNPNDPRLKEGWQQFCEELKSAGELIFRDTTPTDDIDRAKGLRLLARNISLGLQFHLENCDPRSPELLHYFDPLRKQGGDNTDALYLGAPINGQLNYRIRGHRGSARYFAVTVLEDGATPWGGAVVGSLIDDQLAVDDDGFFELHIGPDKQPGNWIRTTPGAWRVTFRQFFADWENEEPMSAQIDCLDGNRYDPELTPEKVIDGLKAGASWVRESTHYWADMLDNWQCKPNVFLSYRQLDDNAIDATPGGEPLICYWKVPDDECLVISVTPPDASYWSVEFGNYWWETMDYRYQLCSTNCHHATLERDGRLLLVVSHEDPGVPNWLDPSGHREGYITVRWMGASHYPVPTCTQVKRESLWEILPEDAQRIEPSRRAEQLAGRRRGALKRFPC